MRDRAQIKTQHQIAQGYEFSFRRPATGSGKETEDLLRTLSLLAKGGDARVTMTLRQTSAVPSDDQGHVEIF